jgi:hypothetical protein
MRKQETLRKIRELAENGGATAGERERARATLETLLEKYGLTEEDLLAEEKSIYTFPYHTTDEFVLLVQIVKMVLDDWQPKVLSPPKKHSRQQQVAFELSAAEACEIYFLYAEYRRELAEQQNAFLVAFLLKNDIGPASDPPGSEGCADCESSSRKHWQTIQIAAVLQKVKISRRAIESNGQER